MVTNGKPSQDLCRKSLAEALDIKCEILAGILPYDAYVLQNGKDYYVVYDAGNAWYHPEYHEFLDMEDVSEFAKNALPELIEEVANASKRAHEL